MGQRQIGELGSTQKSGGSLEHATYTVGVLRRRKQREGLRSTKTERGSTVAQEHPCTPHRGTERAQNREEQRSTQAHNRDGCKKTGNKEGLSTQQVEELRSTQRKEISA